MKVTTAVSRHCWLILLTAVAATGAQGLESIYLVRHADKVAFWPETRELGAFQPLSRAGAERAERLARHLAGAQIAAIYTSATTRTLATGMPLAEATGVPIGPDRRTVDASQMAAFLRELQATHAADKAVLIVGHSNTVPLLLLRLGAEESCYDRLDVADHDGELLISGYEGLWKIDLATPGCDGIERQVVALETANEGGSEGR